MITRSRTGSLRPKAFPDFQLYHTSVSDCEPRTYKQAATDSRWMEAMQQEYDALISNGTWTLCPRPLHHNVIRNKWVFKIKRKGDGTVERLLGFQGSLVDTSLFIYLQGQIQIYMFVYVDDIIITGTHPHIISDIIVKLQSEFPLKDLGPLSYFLGIQVTRDASGLHICQTKYITELLHKTQMDGAKPSKSPCTSGSKLSRLDGETLSDPPPYRQVVGGTTVLHTYQTRNSLFSQPIVSTYACTIDHSLDCCQKRCPDHRRSTTGFAVFLGECLIAWSAKKQVVVSRSSTEAEYRSLSITIAELFWIRILF
ncbi:uncharacterized mitochondrial protein AtMg00810-like [Corylus avellana]|uniref:uncharacterized mitochondrial protein AtMg00810-like n=1 Tax=Corylus avellana TaxID=13451 RepID=UPI00286D4474|nr:uncharacterized mitochondrial protein AtMg00810-like [Corylus avellana]